MLGSKPILTRVLPFLFLSLIAFLISMRFICWQLKYHTDISIILIKFFLRNYAQVLKDYLQAMVQDVKESTGPLFRAATRHTLGEGKLIN